VNSKLERIAAERAAQKGELGALDEAEHHEALHRRILGIDRFDAHEVTGLEVGQLQGSGLRRG
jgi:hypothetical protein